MHAITRLPLILLLWLGVVPFVAAQPAAFRYDLLSLLPDDFAVCVVMHDLRGNANRWERSDWLKTFRQSSLGKSLLDNPEMKQFEHWQAEMQKHLGLDWPAVRDDLLGDTLIFSYTPGSKGKPDDERGLFLLHVRKPAVLLQFIDRLNEIQKKTGELKELSEKQFKGQRYFRRLQDDKAQFYFVKDSLAVVTTKEALLHEVIERRSASPKESSWAKRFRQAGADSAFITLCVNPRRLDAEILQNQKKDDAFPGYWRALDALFVSAAIGESAEVRLSIQANTQQLPDWAKSAFTQTLTASSLWQRFPERSLMTITSQTDFAGAAEALRLLMPAKDRKKLASDWQTGVGAFLSIDLFKDILPNVGPDWGVCILPSPDAAHLPQAIFALEVKPGSKEQMVDQTLFKAVETFAIVAMLDHNKNHPDSIVRLKTLKQGQVEIKYLSNDKLFPAGYQPACALKDGFLLFSTSPEAIANFHLRTAKPDERKESPFLRVSAPELARLLEHRREHILGSLTDRQKMNAAEAKMNLDNVIGLLNLFDHLTFSQQGGAGQATWIVRLTPSRK